MYSKFRLNVEKDSFNDFDKEYGDAIYKKIRKEFPNKTDEIKFTGYESILDGKTMQTAYFPILEGYDVFLSHSHADEDLAIRLAGYLTRHFGLKVFIDSCLWDYSDVLLKKIDDKFCLNDDGKFYSYKKRNYSTSHVHMMLSIALTKMIDQCEAFFFLGTTNSLIDCSVGEQVNKITYSPWIFHELSTLSTLREKTQREISERVAGIESFKMNIGYNLEKELADLMPIMQDDLLAWKKDWEEREDRQSYSALDVLYSIKKMKN